MTGFYTEAAREDFSGVRPNQIRWQSGGEDSEFVCFLDGQSHTDRSRVPAAPFVEDRSAVVGRMRSRDKVFPDALVMRVVPSGLPVGFR